MRPCYIPVYKTETFSFTVMIKSVHKYKKETKHMYLLWFYPRSPD